MEGGSSALSPAAVGGRRRKTGKKLRLVKKTTVRKLLAKKGLKMRGGAEAGVPAGTDVLETGKLAPADAPAEGGRRRRRTGRKSRKSRRGSRKLFGMF
jgi:hypothetical protein